MHGSCTVQRTCFLLLCQGTPKAAGSDVLGPAPEQFLERAMGIEPKAAHLRRAHGTRESQCARSKTVQNRDSAAVSLSNLFIPPLSESPKRTHVRSTGN